VGRLIRAKTDSGIVVILDSRIVSKPYGRAFLAALPKCPVEIH
jgi:ATP-dependent DNA helicase DinG